MPVAGELGRKNNLGGESGQKEPDRAGGRQVCRKAAEGIESLTRRDRTQNGGSGAEREDMQKARAGVMGRCRRGRTAPAAQKGPMEHRKAQKDDLPETAQKGIESNFQP